MTLSTKPTRDYPAIPTVSGDTDSHTRALEALKEAVSIHERRTGSKLASFVRLGELVDIGLVSIQGDRIIAEDIGSEGDSSAVVDIVRGATWVRGSGEIETPVNDVDVVISEACEIVQALIFTEGGPGSCVVDIWRDATANFPPTVADTITASAKPTISSDDSYSDSTLTGWSKSCAAGDVLRFHLDSTSSFTRISVFLVLRKP